MKAYVQLSNFERALYFNPYLLSLTVSSSEFPNKIDVITYSRLSQSEPGNLSKL
jgi:hypothetical protein